MPAKQIARRPGGKLINLADAAGPLPPVNSAYRNPTALDDITRGNVVNGVSGFAGASRLWLNLSSGQFFQCTSNAKGAAAWTSLGTPTALPGDAIAGVTVAYGTKPILAAWANGNLFDVERKSDNLTQTIAAINGVTDVATLNSWLSGTVGQITRWYDQSGNGSDIVQGTIANAPYVRVVGTEVYIVFDGASSGTVARNPFFNLPTVTWGSSFSLFEQTQLTNCIGDNTYSMFEVGTDSSDFQAFYEKTTSQNSWSDQTAVNVAASYLLGADCNPEPFSFISTSVTGSASAYWGERQVTQINWKTKGTPVGGIIGTTAQASGGPHIFDGTMQAYLIWANLAMSSVQALTVRQAMYQTFKTVPQCYNDLIVTDGDSEFSADNAYFPNISGNGILGGAGYFGMVQALTGNGGAGLLNRPCRWINTAVSGQLLSQISSAYATRDVPLIDPNARNRIILFNGGEHEADTEGELPATVMAALQTFCTTVSSTHSPSWTAVFYCDVASYNASVGAPFSGTMETWRALFNPLARAGPLAINGLMDVGDTTRPLGAVNGYTNATYFAPDGIHWGGTNAQGAALAAAMMAKLFNSQLGAI